MRPRVYLETSIVSYLAAQPSGDLVTAAHQRITHQWWTRVRDQSGGRPALGKSLTERTTTMPDTSEKPWEDPIVAEVRQARATLFKAAGFDIEEFCRQLQSRQAVSGQVVVKDLPSRPVNEAT